MSIQGKDIINLYKKQPVPLTSIALLIISFAVFYIRFDTLSEITTKLVDSEASLKKYKNNISASTHLEAQYDVVRKANAKFAASAFKVPDLAKNPQILYSLGEFTGVRVIEARQNAVVAAPKGAAPDSFVSIPFTVSAEGEFVPLMRFLKRLEFGDQVVRVNTAALSPKNDRNLILNLTIDILGTR